MSSQLTKDFPAIRLVTPSFNHGRFIDATVRSVLDQNYPNLHYLVMDGGSTDDTVERLKRYEGRLHWISQRDAGQADAIAKGFAAGDEPILAWLNSDDCLKPGSLHAAGAFLRDHPGYALVYGEAEFIRADGSYLCPCANTEPFDRDRLRHFSDYIVQPAAFFRRSAYEAAGGLDSSLHYAMDYDLWLKLADHFDFAHVPACWAQYRWLGDNKSAAGDWQRLAEVATVVKRHKIGGLPAYFRLEAANLHWTAARRRWLAGDRLAAATAFAGACLAAVASPRALWSLTDPQTRRLIETGRRLRESTAEK